MSVEDRDDLRETADEIVSRPEFREEQPTLVERALDRVFEELGDLIGQVVGSGGGYFVGYAILAVALGLAAYFVWRFFPRRRLLASSDSYDIVRETTVRRSRDEWLELAAEAESKGDWDAAVHARYHALTAGLADEERLAPATSTTSGEHRRAFAAAAARAEAGSDDGAGPIEVFNRAIDRYEEVWFGGDPADQPDSRDFAEADRALLDGGR